jgi:TolA-binding protein
MNPSLENMSTEQLKEMVRIQAIKAKESEDQISRYKRTIEDFKKEVQTIEQEKESILKEKESILQKFQALLEKFSSMKFEFSQLKRLVYGSKRERFISNEENGQMSLPFEVETKSAEDEQQATEEISFKRRKPDRSNHKGRISLPDHLPVEEMSLNTKLLY